VALQQESGGIELPEHEGHASMLLTRRLYRDLNVLAEGGQKIHKALDREVARLPTHQRRDVGLFDAKYPSSRHLGESATLDDPVDFEREPGLELLTFRIGKAEVSKDIAAALFDQYSVILPHLSSAFSL